MSISLRQYIRHFLTNKINLPCLFCSSFSDTNEANIESDNLGGPWKAAIDCTNQFGKEINECLETYRDDEISYRFDCQDGGYNNFNDQVAFMEEWMDENLLDCDGLKDKILKIINEYSGAMEKSHLFAVHAGYFDISKGMPYLDFFNLIDFNGVRSPRNHWSYYNLFVPGSPEPEFLAYFYKVWRLLC